jgi:hypothetical protein
MDLKDTNKIRAFCAACDAEINCRANHAAESTRPPACESCPLALAIDVSRQLQTCPDKNMYDAVRIAVRRAIAEEKEREILFGVLRESIEGK